MPKLRSRQNAPQISGRFMIVESLKELWKPLADL